jgi:hypothetical protein
MERKKGRKIGRIEEQPGKEAMRLYSEKQACPRSRNPTAVKTYFPLDGNTFFV